MDANNKKLNEISDYDTISKSINRTKLKFYSNKNILLHIVLLNGDFRNAYIKDEHSTKVWNIEERKLGATKIFEEEIKKIEEYVPKKEIE